MVPNTQHNNVSKGLLTFSGIIEVLDCIPINILCLQYSTVYRNSCTLEYYIYSLLVL